MSLVAVREWFGRFGMEDRIMELTESTATVAEAAIAHNVEPDQIAKTLSFKVGDEPILIVVSGQSRIDNPKYKARFGKKAKMLTPQEALEFTGHPVGGVCPFGLKTPVAVYLDVSLKKHQEILPAAGEVNASLRMTIAELETCSEFKEWVNVCKEQAPQS